MITYVAIVAAKPDCVADVAAWYAAQDPFLAAAPGFLGREVLQAQPGVYLQAALAVLGRSAPAPAATAPDDHNHDGHDHGPAGVTFLNIERWATVEDRARYAMRDDARARSGALGPLLLPAHSHDLYLPIVSR